MINMTIAGVEKMCQYCQGTGAVALREFYSGTNKMTWIMSLCPCCCGTGKEGKV